LQIQIADFKLQINANFKLLIFEMVTKSAIRNHKSAIFFIRTRRLGCCNRDVSLQESFVPYQPIYAHQYRASPLPVLAQLPLCKLEIDHPFHDVSSSAT